MFLGAASGLVINVISTRYTERAPILEAYLNGEHLAEDVVFVYPTNTTPYEFTFWIHNTGDMTADQMFIRWVTHSYSTNFIHGPKWSYEDLGALARKDPIMAAMVQYGDKALPHTFGANFQPFSVNPEKVRIFCGFLTYGAIGARTKTGRVHLAFENPAGLTNVFRGDAARDYISKLDPAAAKRTDIGMLKLLFGSTNELLSFQRNNPSVRTE